MSSPLSLEISSCPPAFGTAQSHPASTITLANAATLSLHDASLLRATTPSVLLERFGRRLRSTSGGIGTTAVAGEDEFQKSFIVHRIDVFLSHSWHAPWWKKYLMLLFFFNALPACIVTLITAVVVGAAWHKGFMLGTPASWHNGTVSGASPLLPCTFIFFTCLVFWQSIVALIGKFGTHVFLDKVCINQTEEAQKAAGIRAIGAMLARTNTLLVAWDQTYFERLWCTFELAAFRFANTHGNIILIPIELGRFALSLICLSALRQYLFLGLENYNCFLGVRIYFLGLRFTRGTCLFALCYLCQALLGIREYWNLLNEVSTLKHQLKSFSVRQAKCFCCSSNHVLSETGQQLSCDRELVNSSIAEWYGSSDSGLQAFDSMIRGPFTEDVGEAVKGSRLPYTFALTASIWGGLHILVKIFDRQDRLSCIRRILCFTHEVFFEFPLNIGLLIQAIHLCHLDQNTGSQKPSHGFWHAIKLVGLSCANAALLMVYSQGSDYILHEENVNMLWGISLLLVEGVIVFWLYRDRTSK